MWWDASHTLDKPDERESAMVKAAKDGNLQKCQEIISKCSSEAEKTQMLNGARRWTELDYKASGFVNEWEWWDVTPVTAAAMNGHIGVLEYLLRQGADPTLSSCPMDNVYMDAFQAAPYALKKIEDDIDTVLNKLDLEQLQRTRFTNAFYSLPADMWLKKSTSSDDAAVKMVQAKLDRIRCIEMLETIKPFWKPAVYCGHHYSADARKEFTNKPTDRAALLKALDTVPVDTKETAAQRDLTGKLAARIKAYVEIQEEIKAKKEAEQKRHQEERKRYRPPSPERGPDGRPYCRHWLRGNCWYGDSCRFYHPLEEDEEQDEEQESDYIEDY